MDRSSYFEAVCIGRCEGIANSDEVVDDRPDNAGECDGTSAHGDASCSSRCRDVGRGRRVCGVICASSTLSS